MDDHEPGCPNVNGDGGYYRLSCPVCVGPAAWPPGDRAVLQQRLVAEGLLVDPFRWGVWDGPSRAAYSVWRARGEGA